MRWLALAVFCAVGCSSTAPVNTVLVEVRNGTSIVPGAVMITVFDDYGEIGQSTIQPAQLPGQITITGLPSHVASLRVVALGSPMRLLDGKRIATSPAAQVVELLTLSDTTADFDFDGVPDLIDDCPMVSDPMQTNHAGAGPGDACRGDAAPPPGDLAAVDLGVPDLAGVDLAGDDLAATPVHDLANPHPDLATDPALFTEGFESGGIPAVWSTGNQTNGFVSADNTRAHRGAWSLHVHDNAISTTGMTYSLVDITETQTVPLPDLYIRAFLYVPSSPAPDPTSTAFFIVDQNVSPYAGINLNMVNGSFGTYNNVPTPTVASNATTPLLPLDTWACLEWHIHVSTTTGFAKAYLGGSVAGTEIASLSGTQDTQPSPTLGVIGFGLVSFPSGNVPARDAWFDDLAVSNNPIGCTQ